MLEWYCAHTDYIGVLEETKTLIQSVWDGAPTEWKTVTVSDAFIEYAGWDPAGNYDEDRFDMDLVEKVEPTIKETGGAVFLIDYPVEAAALSRRKADNPLLAERWELYIEGIELANAYSELTDPEEQRNRFDECAEKRAALGKTVYSVDEQFLQSLGKMPPTGGVALGIDRLLMLISRRKTLKQVISFAQSDS